MKPTFFALMQIGFNVESLNSKRRRPVILDRLPQTRSDQFRRLTEEQQFFANT